MKEFQYGLKCKDLDFVSYKVAEDGIKGRIYVFGHTRNGKVRKRKVDCVGYITKHDKTRKYAFVPNPEWCFCGTNLLIIGAFVFKLEHKRIVLTKQGEIKKNGQ